MFKSILKKLNLCHSEELENANKIISGHLMTISKLNKRIKDLEEQLKLSRSQSASIKSKVEEYLSDIKFRDEKIASLNQELIDEKYRHDRLQDFEVAESKLLEEARASIKAYQDAEGEGRIIVNPCKPGNNVYWVARGFDSSIKQHTIRFNECLGYAVIELYVRAIITNDQGTIILMDPSKCIDNMPFFHIEDFGKCIFTNIDDANNVFNEIIKNTTPVERQVEGYLDKKIIDASDIVISTISSV